MSWISRRMELSLGFMPQTSLSVLDHGLHPRRQFLSLGFMPQTSLSEGLARRHRHRFTCLWGSCPRLR